MKHAIALRVAGAIALFAGVINKGTPYDSSVKDRNSVMPVTGACGFGGWLVLVTIGVFVSPLVTIIKMLGINRGFDDFVQEFWFMLDGDIGIHLAVIFMQICTAVFMVLRSKRFVSVYIGTSICMVLLLPAEIIWLSSMLYWQEGIHFSWLRVSGTAKMPQIDQSVRHQLHTVVALLFELKAQQKPFEFVLPGKGPLHAEP